MIKKILFPKELISLLTQYNWLITIIILIIFWNKAIILAFFIFLGPLPQIYKRFIARPLGLELQTFFTIMISYWINPLVAWLLVPSMIVLGMIFDGTSIHKFTFVKYTIICILAYIFILSGLNIKIAGIIITVIINIILSYMYLTVSKKESKKAIPSLVINAILNILLFSSIASPLLSGLS